MPRDRKEPYTQSISTDVVGARHEVFRAEFKKNGGNATHAALAAGYSPKSAHVTGTRLAKRYELRAAASERAAASLEKSHLEESEVLGVLRAILKHDPRKLYYDNGSLRPVSEWDDETAMAVSSLDSEDLYSGKGPGRKKIGEAKKVRTYDRLAAVDKAMRYLGMYERDNRQRENNLVVNIGLVNAPRREEE